MKNVATSLVTRHATDGSDLYAIISVSAIRSLTPAQITGLAELDIRRVSDLLHYRPIHDARLIAAVAAGQIAHDPSVADLVDAGVRNLTAAELLSRDLSDLRDIGDVTLAVFKNAFGISTIGQLAEFKPFEEAQQFLLPEADEFHEPASAPTELMPRMVGAVQSTATYSSFVKEQTLRLKGIELTYDDARVYFVDQRLAGLFPVQGFGRPRWIFSLYPLPNLPNLEPAAYDLDVSLAPRRTTTPPSATGVRFGRGRHRSVG